MAVICCYYVQPWMLSILVYHHMGTLGKCQTDASKFIAVNHFTTRGHHLYTHTHTHIHCLSQTTNITQPFIPLKLLRCISQSKVGLIKYVACVKIKVSNCIVEFWLAANNAALFITSIFAAQAVQRRDLKPVCHTLPSLHNIFHLLRKNTRWRVRLPTHFISFS